MSEGNARSLRVQSCANRQQRTSTFSCRSDSSERMNEKTELTVSPFRRGLHFFPCTEPLVSPGSVGHVQIHFETRQGNSWIPQSNDSSPANAAVIIPSGCYNYGRVGKASIVANPEFLVLQSARRLHCSACRPLNHSLSLSLTALQVACSGFRKRSETFGNIRRFANRLLYSRKRQGVVDLQKKRIK